MNGVGTGRRLLQRLLHSWPQKLGALALAVVLWLFITTSSVSTTQRSLLVDLSVEGVQPSQVAVGVPTVVEVTVSGPSPRVDRLDAGDINAVLDLTGLSGQFQRTIDAQTPLGVKLVGVSPSDVIGYLETVTSRDLALTPALRGAPPGNAVLSVAADPPTVTLTGRSQLLDRVDRVVALAPAEAGSVKARPFALDAGGVPIQDVKIAPDTVTLTVTGREALVTKSVAIDLAAPEVAGLQDATLDQPEVTVAGPPAALADLASVRGTVQPPTQTSRSGRYTVPVKLDLPPGVVAMGTPTAVLRFAAAPSTP